MSLVKKFRNNVGTTIVLLSVYDPKQVACGDAGQPVAFAVVLLLNHLIAFGPGLFLLAFGEEGGVDHCAVEG